MAEYIKRKAAIEAAKHAWAKGLEPSQYIEALPAADVAPLVHARWIKGSSNPYCPKCFVECRDETPFCPNCGAMMDGGDSNVAD
mgnify:CR=1 FL=1